MSSTVVLELAGGSAYIAGEYPTKTREPGKPLELTLISSSVARRLDEMLIDGTCHCGNLSSRLTGS